MAIGYLSKRPGKILWRKWLLFVLICVKWLGRPPLLLIHLYTSYPLFAKLFRKQDHVKYKMCSYGTSLVSSVVIEASGYGSISRRPFWPSRKFLNSNKRKETPILKIILETLVMWGQLRRKKKFPHELREKILYEKFLLKLILRIMVRSTLFLFLFLWEHLTWALLSYRIFKCKTPCC